jgi:hypothetical protein
MLTFKQRVKAIFNCLWFGILPSYIYEKECHYKKHNDENTENYYQHMIMNLQAAKCLILKTEHECTHEFHKIKWKKYFRWQYK